MERFVEGPCGHSIPQDVTPELAVQVAQAAATLALVEQQRIANRIARGEDL